MLTQSEADNLMALEKKRSDDTRRDFPVAGEKLTLPVESMDGREKFQLDISRGRIRLTKCTYQERYQSINILLRLDLDGPPHPNPEVNAVPLAFLAPYIGKTLQPPHLHLYVEGYLDKWAIPLPNGFSNPGDLFVTFQEFCSFCNIKLIPLIRHDALT